VSDTTSYAHDKYISLDKAMRLLDVSFERITWFIATSRLAWKRDPRDGNRKLVSLRDVQQLRNSPHLLAPWISYALVDPRDNAVRYVGRAYEPQIRFKAHLKDEYAANPAKYRWIRELRKNRLLPHMEVLEGVYGSLRDADTRERAWIQHFINAGAALTNIQYMD
jgi:hypothetical protein